MRQPSNQECRKKGKNSSRAAQKFTRRRNVRGAHASSVLVSASCRNELKIRRSPRNTRMNTKEKMAQHFRVWGAHAASALIRETRERNCGYLSILWNRRVMLLTDMAAVRFGDDPRTLI